MIPEHFRANLLMTITATGRRADAPEVVIGSWVRHGCFVHVHLDGSKNKKRRKRAERE